MLDTLAVVCLVMLDTFEGRLDTLAMPCFVMLDTLLVMLDTFAMLVIVFRRPGAAVACGSPPTADDTPSPDASDPEMLVSVYSRWERRSYLLSLSVGQQGAKSVLN